MTIVLGYDESPGADRALDQAITLAGQLSDRLVVVYGAAPPSMMGEEYGAHLAALSEIGHTALTAATEKARAAGVDTVVELTEDKPAEALLEAAEKYDARVIVVGTYGESPLRGAMLGSTPHKLLHWSHRPVLCVPPPERA
ncbi:universal stress protein [Nakamurella flava]|uniref:Universal stress protein n=1 Tax=Nakamurella flava TaxID=2576308 RepID=A0A4U6QMS8_9ACTN|nr:universal stress protein [Nakamurella flava]TKV61903.1 universal stress protein [Nakamurella flava]